MDGGLGVWGGVGLAGRRQQSIVKEINERGSRVCVRSFWKGESRKQGGVRGGAACDQFKSYLLFYPVLLISDAIALGCIL